jgi:hypothetical protein
MRKKRRSDRDGGGLLARVIERRRLGKSPSPEEGAANLGGQADPDPQDGRIAALESRLNHLESLVEGLQDAVHRDSTRHEREIRDLEHKTAPAEISRSLAEHDREQRL